MALVGTPLDVFAARPPEAESVTVMPFCCLVTYQVRAGLDLDRHPAATTTTSTTVRRGRRGRRGSTIASGSNFGLDLHSSSSRCGSICEPVDYIWSSLICNG
jgi:hypothetical protein